MRANMTSRRKQIDGSQSFQPSTRPFPLPHPDSSVAKLPQNDTSRHTLLRTTAVILSDCKKRRISLHLPESLSSAPILGLLLGGLLAVVYGFTMLPGLGWEDAPEFALAIDCLGIPHSPGFPLFVLAGRVVALLGSISGARAATILSSLSVAYACGILVGMLARRYSLLMSVLAGLSVGLSPPIWFQATRGEIYGLHLLLATLLLVVCISTVRPRTAFLAGYLLALGVTNHPSLLALSPLLLRFMRNRRHVILLALGLFFGGTIILFMPLRSMQHPFLDWGHTRHLGNFIWMISLQEFAGDFFSLLLLPGGGFKHAAQEIGFFFFHAVPPLLLGLVVVGLPVLVRQSGALFGACAALILLTGAGGGGPDTEGYLLPLVPALAILALDSVAVVGLRQKILMAVWGLSLILLVGPEMRSLDRSGDRSASAYQRALAGQLKGKILFTDNTPDLFLLLHHAHETNTPHQVVFTPYLGLEWYHESLPRPLRTLLPQSADPHYGVVEHAAQALRAEPVYSFSSLPEGALGTLAPNGWLFRTGRFAAYQDSLLCAMWPSSSCPARSPGMDHRAIRLGQGGQLLLAKKRAARASERFGAALQSDPDNPALWMGLARALAMRDKANDTASAVRAGMRISRGDRTTQDVLLSVLAETVVRTPTSQGLALLCSLAADRPANLVAASGAARGALVFGDPKLALKNIEQFRGSPSPELLNLYGTALMHQGKTHMAEPAFVEAIELTGSLPRLQQRIAWNLALCLLKQGEQARAESVAREYGLRTQLLRTQPAPEPQPVPPKGLSSH